jgi:hypothetical protein
MPTFLFLQKIPTYNLLLVQIDCISKQSYWSTPNKKLTLVDYEPAFSALNLFLIEPVGTLSMPHFSPPRVVDNRYQTSYPIKNKWDNRP